MAGNGLGSAAVPRGARRLTLRFERQEAFADQYAQHLAKGGAFVATDESFTLREVVEVQLDLVFASQFLSLAAEVVHCLTPDQAPDGVEPGVAVQFLDPATVLRERFAPFLEASEPPPPPPRATRRRPPEPAPDPGETRVLDSLDADPPTATLDSMPLALARNWEAGDDSELASLGDPSEVSFEGLGPAEDLTDGGAELVGDPVEGFETNSVAETDERTFIERAVREPARLPVEIRGPTGAALRGRTRNVSDTGVLISVDGEELPIGREVQLNLIHPRTGEHVTVPGRVARHGPGEGIGQMPLVPAQDVDGEVLDGQEDLKAVGLAVQAEQHQGRVEGHRVEGVGGQTQQAPVGRDRRHHRDAGGEAPHGGAKRAGIEGHDARSPPDR